MAIFGFMNEEINTQENVGEVHDTKDSLEKSKSDRIKRMRGWMGVRSDIHTGNISVDGEAPSYGDAPNGWNR